MIGEIFAISNTSEFTKAMMSIEICISSALSGLFVLAREHRAAKCVRGLDKRAEKRSDLCAG